MSNPTSNYSFQMPTNTDLVYQLPADFEVFGQAVDTQMKTNADAATQKATLTTKGDLYAASAASTPARVAVGTNGQVLTADSTESTGVKWATLSTSSGLNLITNQALSSQATINFNSCFSATYRNYKVIMNLTSTATDTVRLRLRSGSTDASGANYNVQYVKIWEFCSTAKKFDTFLIKNCNLLIPSPT